jgi:hypothetical protein
MQTDKGTVLRQIAALIFFLLVATGAQAEDNKTDPWQPLRFIIGSWQGTVSGQSGSGTVSRSYEFILNDKFIQENNTSTYPPQKQNKAGEVHHHLGLISYDRKRKTLMLRQFHEEGFVNLYALNQTISNSVLLVFESENFENFDNSWKAKETYEIISNNEFVETFELAPPGKPFEVYSRNHFKRAQ